MRSSSRHPEEGSAAVEFLLLGVLLLVPLLYLVLTLSALQGAAFATDGAARQAARAYALAPDDAAGAAAADDAVRTALTDWHIANGASQVGISCTPEPRLCHTARGRLTVAVQVAVALPLLPPALHLHAPGTILIDGTASQQVSRFEATAG